MIPQIERKRLEPTQYRTEQVAQGVETSRKMVVDNDDPAARPRDPQRFAERPPANRLGLLVQQKEQDGLVIGCIRHLQVCRITQPRRHARVKRKFLAQVVKLDRQHIDDIERCPLRKPVGEPRRKITIDAGDLQGPARDTPTKLIQRGVAQP